MTLAPHKTEAVLLTPRRRMTPITFEIGNTTIVPQRAIKYLGVWLDKKLTFAEHVDRTAQKTARTVAALGRLMPNVGGPKASKRKILASVALSTALYAAPVWGSSLRRRDLKQKLESVLSKISARVCSAYRTASAAAVAVISGVPPVDLLATEREEVFDGINKTVARANLIERWQMRWTDIEQGCWTRKLIPNIKKWWERNHGEVDYYLTQLLSGHGCFRAYLHKVQIVEDSACLYCGEDDNAEHTLFYCQRWEELRETCAREINTTLNSDNMIDLMITTEHAWNTIKNMSRKMMETKRREAEELIDRNARA